MSLNPDPHAEQSKLIFIDSEDGEIAGDGSDLSGLSSNFILDLEESVICPANQEMLVSMYECSLPYSFYDIRNNINDKIRFKTSIPLGASITWEIDFGSEAMSQSPYYSQMSSIGNYNVTTLSVQANLIYTTLLRTGQVATSHANAGSTIEFVYIPHNGRYMIKFDDFPTGLVIELEQQGLGYMDVEIGLPEEDTTTRLFSEVGGTGVYFLQNPNVVDTSGSTHGLFLRTNLTTNSSMDSETGRGTDILAHIPITSQAGEIIHSPPQANLHKSRVKSKTINHIHIDIRDERNRPLDFNGLHTHIVLLIDFVYDQKKIIPSPYFRRQKEHFQQNIDRQTQELRNQGFKGPLTIKSRPRRVAVNLADIAGEPHNPEVTITEEKTEKEHIQQLKDEEKKMEEIENIPVVSSGGLSSADTSAADANRLVSSTI
jgi:hypothetical protein